MKILLCQTSPALLDLKTNLQEVIDKIGYARDQGAQLVVFPELALTGYFVGHQYHQVALRMDSPEIRELSVATKGTAAVVGFIEESPSMNFYNSALVAVDGHPLFAYRKLNLPNYGVFEERKYFSPGKRVPVFRLYGFNVAVFLCNDLWHPALPYLAITRKADIFLSLINSCDESMGTEFSNMESWRIINTFYARVFGIYHACVNRAGKETWDPSRCLDPLELHRHKEEIDSGFPRRGATFHFWGGSSLVNPFGKTEVQGPLHEPAEIMGEISRELVRKKRILLPYLRNDDPYFTHRELHQILYGDGASAGTPPLWKGEIL